MQAGPIFVACTNEQVTGLGHVPAQSCYIWLVEPHVSHSYGKVVCSLPASDIKIAASEQFSFNASLDVVMADSKNGSNSISVAFADVIVEETFQIGFELHHEQPVEIHNVVPPEFG